MIGVRLSARTKREYFDPNQGRDASGKWSAGGGSYPGRDYHGKSREGRARVAENFPRQSGEKTRGKGIARGSASARGQKREHVNRYGSGIVISRRYKR